MADENVKAMIARCNACSGVVFMAVDTPKRQRELAKEVAGLIRNGLRPAPSTVGECRTAEWCRCERASNKKPKQAEISL